MAHPQPAVEQPRYQQVAPEPVRYAEAPPEAEAVRMLPPPEPLLAPAPAAEPDERLPAMTTMSRPEERREEPHITTRHDAEHGSVAARSVLDRLGVSSSGAGGGRRRAGDKPIDQPPAEPAAEAHRPGSSPGRAAEAHAPEPVAETPRAEPAPEPEKPAQEEGWLPKLRLPPSLAPVDEYTSEYGRPNYDLSSGDYTPPAPPADFVIPTEDPPPDAGLAELLALALAEHRAGTSSAAALVKRLGTQSDEEPAQPVNGSSRRGEYDHGRRQAGGEA